MFFSGIIFLLCGLIACGGEPSSLVFDLGVDREVPLLERPAGGKQSVSPFYFFEEPLEMPEGLDHIKITYIPLGASAEMELYTGKNEIIHAEPLPSNEGGLRTREYRFPLPELSALYGFRFTAEDREGLPVVSAAGFAEGRAGVYYTDDTLGTVSGWKAEFSHNSERVFSIETGGGRIFSLEYAYYPDSADEVVEGVEVRCVRNGEGAQKERTWRFYPKRGEHTVYFHCGEFQAGSAPDGSNGSDAETKFILATPKTPFDSLVFEPYRSSAFPIPADPGTILHYPEDGWRNSAYEVFSWNLFPKMLIFDTRDYGVQADFFRRLAFFVEKEGYTGRLLSDAELTGRHGWNAHDYRSIDLAAFFQAARDRRFALNEREKELRTILLDNGIIRFDKEHGLYLPVEGGCISLSRSSDADLRDLFMVHECIHGIFFSSEAYREASFRFWEELSEEELAYWELFFGWMSYDLGNLYLLVNELQAYLLQRPAGQAEYYFHNHRAVPAIRTDPARGDLAAELLEEQGEPFKRRAEEARELLYRTTGIWIDRLYCLEETATPE